MAGRRPGDVGQPADHASRPSLRPQRGARHAPHDARRRRAADVAGRLMHGGALPERAQALIDFWFGPAGDPERESHRDLWFRSPPEHDARLRQLFLADYQRAAAGALEAWEEAPEGALALVLLLDQIP